MTTGRLAVVGATGRMGRAVVRLAPSVGLDVVCAVGHGEVGRDAGELAGVGPIGVAVVESLEALAAARPDVVVDFSAPEVTVALARMAEGKKLSAAIVSGTTGLTKDDTVALDRASAVTAVLWEANMSVGVHVLARLVSLSTELLGPELDIEIVETHHGKKVDAPSGTALRLLSAVQNARKGESHVVHGREGRPGPRPRGEIGLHALRGGDVIGDHSVHFLGQGERIELTHRATSRDLFAQGALRAASWICGRAPGRYRLGDLFA